MTAEHVATAEPPSEPDPVTHPQPADPSQVFQAESIEIGIGPGEDPFDAIFLLAGTDPQGRELALWIRLTPTTITDITEQLSEVLFAQQQILGVDGHPRTSDSDDTDEADNESEPPAGRMKQFFDPMGLRHLKERSPRTTMILGAAIGSLVLLAFILKLVHG